MAALPMTILCFVIFLASIAFSMMGQGGGTIYTPIQVWLGINFHTAATNSLFLIMVTSLSATLVFHKAAKIDWPLAILFESVTTLAGFAGGFYSALFSETVLSLLFAVVITLIGIFMIRDPAPIHKEAGRGPFSWKRKVYGQVYSVNVPLALGIAVIAGVASGLLGIGGGIVKVPLMVLLLGVPMDIAVGSSAFMVGVTALGGFWGHLVRGHWEWKISLILALFVFIGAQIGSRLSLGTEKPQLRKANGWLLLFVAIIMIVQVYTS